MTVFLSFVKIYLSAILGMMLLQFGPPAVPQDNPNEDPFARATTPPMQFLTFNSDFSSLNKDKFIQYVHPNRGLVKNGILLTKDEADKDFQSGQSAGKGIQSVNITFNYGEFVGANCYQADTWVEYKGTGEDGQPSWFRFHNIFVFEIIDGNWYLVQSEYIASDPGIRTELKSGINQAQNVDPDLQKFVVGETEPVLPGATPWPLLIGSNFVSEGNLRQIEGKTWDNKSWTLAHAVEDKKTTVLYFYAVYQLLVAPEDEFHGQMNFLSGLYDTYDRKDLYIYGVTDEPREKVTWLAGAGFNKFSPLMDEGSKLHANLNIDLHPYIVVFDSEGTVIAVNKGYHPSGYPLIKERIRGAIAKSKAPKS
jgi:hypothetical protein